MSYELQVQNPDGIWEYKLACSTPGLAICHVELYEELYKRSVRVINTKTNIIAYPKADTKEQEHAEVCERHGQATNADNIERTQERTT